MKLFVVTSYIFSEQHIIGVVDEAKRNEFISKGVNKNDFRQVELNDVTLLNGYYCTVDINLSIADVQRYIGFNSSFVHKFSWEPPCNPLDVHNTQQIFIDKLTESEAVAEVNQRIKVFYAWIQEKGWTVVRSRSMMMVHNPLVKFAVKEEDLTRALQWCREHNVRIQYNKSGPLEFELTHEQADRLTKFLRGS